MIVCCGVGVWSKREQETIPVDSESPDEVSQSLHACNVAPTVVVVVVVVVVVSEFGEVDDEKLSDAVNTFIHSCAGYSVATYALVEYLPSNKNNWQSQ